MDILGVRVVWWDIYSTLKLYSGGACGFWDRCSTVNIYFGIACSLV